MKITPSKKACFAVSVSKKISKSSVVRNKIRRRVYSAIHHLIPNVKNNLYLLIAKPGADKIGGDGLKQELAGLFKRV